MLPELTTERLTLREITLEDAPELQTWRDWPEQWSQQAVEPEEHADVAARIGNYLKYRGSDEQRRIMEYVARCKRDGAIVGTVSFSRPYQHPAIASLGIGVARPLVGRGYGTELVGRLLAFGFGELRLNRVEADVALENKACIRVLEKVGMQREGVLRECIWAQGRWWTEAKYALLASEARAA